MKKTILLLAIASAASMAAASDNFLRIPLHGMSKGAVMAGHPATSGLPGQGNPAPGGGDGETKNYGLSLRAIFNTFGDIPVGGTSPVIPVTVENTGNVATTMTFGFGGELQIVEADNTCVGSLPAGAQCQVGVVFKPVNEPGYAMSLSMNVKHEAGRGGTVNFTGSAHTTSQAKLSVTPMVDMTPTVVGKLYGKQFSVTNSGTASMTLGDVSVVSPINGEYWILSKTCGATLAAGDTCRIGIRFSPLVEAAGRTPAVVSLPNNGADAYGRLGAQSSTFSYSGQSYMAKGILYYASADKNAPYAIGTVPVGGNLSIPLTNLGNAPLTISSIEYEGDLVFTDNCPVKTVEPGSNDCKVTFTAAGVAPGNYVVSTKTTHTGHGGVTTDYTLIVVRP